MGKGDVNLKIGAESTEAVKSVQDFQKSVAKSLGEIEKNFGVIKTAAVAAFAVFAGKEVIGFLKDGFDAAIKQEDAMARLGHQMKLTGDFSTGALEHFKDFADQMERTTKYGDDVILSQLAIAKSFGASNQEAEDLVKAATELSAAYGLDLDTTVKELGQSLSGTSGKLAKQIPEVKDLTDAQLAHGDAIKIVLERYGGSAVAELDTFGGAVTHLAAAWDNVKEAIATVITSSPVVTEAIKATTKVINNLEDSINDSSGGLKRFVENGILYLTASLGTATEGLGYFVGAVRVAVIPVEALGTAIVKVNQLMDDWKQRLTQPVFGIFSDHITTTGDILNQEYAKAVENTNSQLDSMGESTAKAALFFDDLGNKLAEAASKDRVATNTHVESSQKRTRVLESEKKAAEEAKKSYEEYLAMLAEEGRKAFDALHDVPESLIHDIDKQIAEIPKKIADATSAAAANPASFAVSLAVEKLDVKPVELTKFQSQMAGAAVGLIGAMLDGASGAKSLISSGAGAIADALIPGIGGAVGGIVSKLAEGPEATKKFIKEFIAAVPDIMTAVAESVPVVVETLVDVMVNRGGAARIGIATARAMAGEGILKSLGKQLGLDFGRSFNLMNIPGTIAEGFRIGSEYISDFPTKFNEAITNFQNAGHEVGIAVSDALKDLPGNIKTAIYEGAVQLETSVFSALSAAGTAIMDTLKEGIKNLALPEISIPTPGWVDGLIEALNRFSFDIPGSGGGGGGGGGVVGALSGAFLSGGGVVYAASGMSVRGTDTVPAMLTPGELVIPRNDVSRLRNFLDSQDGATSGDTNGAMLALLAQILAALNRGTTIQTDLKIDSQSLGKAILNLSRNNARLSA